MMRLGEKPIEERLAFVRKHFDSFKSLSGQRWRIGGRAIPLIDFLAADARKLLGYAEKSSSSGIVHSFINLYEKHFTTKFDVLDGEKPKFGDVADKVKKLVIDYFVETAKCSMTKSGLAKVGALGQKCDDALLEIFVELIDLRDVVPGKYHSSKEVEKVGVEVAVYNQLNASISGHPSSEIVRTTNIKDAIFILAKEIDLIKQRL